MYLDETGDHNLNKINSQYGVFGLGGTIINDEDLQHISNELDSLKLGIFGNRNIVFHSVDLRKRRKEFVLLSNNNIRQEFYSKFNNFVIESPIQFISVFIDKLAHLKKYSSPYDPYEWSMGLIMERFVKILREDNAIGRIIVESRGKREDDEIRSAFIRAMFVGTQFMRPKTFQSVLKNELVFETKKSNGLGLQISDMMLYPVARALINDDPRNPAFQIVAAKMRAGYGCHIFPSHLHPGWMTLAYSNYPKFLQSYPVLLLP